MNPASQPLQRLDADSAVIVALGCNDKGVWGSCLECLEAVLVHFAAEGLEVVAKSRWWTSQAWPNPEDPPFINGVVAIGTEEGPEALMQRLSRIETHFGRQRSLPNAPRTLDLDLVAYGRLSSDLNGLLLPHPRSADRLFVMGPVADIMPDWIHPVAGRTAADLAAQATVGGDARPLG